MPPVHLFEWFCGADLCMATNAAEQTPKQCRGLILDAMLCLCCRRSHCWRKSWSAEPVVSYLSGFAAMVWCRGDELILLHVLPQQADSYAAGAPPVDILTVASPLPHVELVQQAQQHIEDCFLPSTLDLSPTPTVQIVTVSTCSFLRVLALFELYRAAPRLHILKCTWGSEVVIYNLMLACSVVPILVLGGKRA